MAAEEAAGKKTGLDVVEEQEEEEKTEDEEEEQTSKQKEKNQRKKKKNFIHAFKLLLTIGRHAISGEISLAISRDLFPLESLRLIGKGSLEYM